MKTDPIQKKMPKVKSCFYLMYHFIFFVSLIASIVHRRLDSSSGWYLGSTESISNIKLFLWTESSSIPIRIKSEDTPKTWQSFWSVDKDIPFWPHSIYPRKEWICPAFRQGLPGKDEPVFVRIWPAAQFERLSLFSAGIPPLK